MAHSNIIKFMLNLQINYYPTHAHHDNEKHFQYLWLYIWLYIQIIYTDYNNFYFIKTYEKYYQYKILK